MKCRFTIMHYQMHLNELVLNRQPFVHQYSHVWDLFFLCYYINSAFQMETYMGFIVSNNFTTIK